MIIEMRGGKHRATARSYGIKYCKCDRTGCEGGFDLSPEEGVASNEGVVRSVHPLRIDSALMSSPSTQLPRD